MDIMKIVGAIVAVTALIVATVGAVVFISAGFVYDTEVGIGGQPKNIDGIEWVLYFGEIDTTAVNQTVESNSPDNEAEKNEPLYYLHSQRDLSLGSVKRYEYRLVVNGQLNKTQLTELTKEFIEKQKSEQPFNAMTVLLFDDERFITENEFKPSLGMVDYAPDGIWGNAMNVKTGEYDTMQLKDEIIDKHWELKPSEEDMGVYVDWMYNKDLYLKETGDEFLSIEKYPKYLAGKLGIDADTVSQRYTNVSNWQSNTLPEEYADD